MKYVKQNHCFHCPWFDLVNLKCTYNQDNCIAEVENEEW